MFKVFRTDKTSFQKRALLVFLQPYEECSVYTQCPGLKSHFYSFSATRGRTYRGDIAIDDIQFVGCALPPVSNSCPEFTCARKSCVKNDYVCDYNDDCGDNSDESRCGMAV